MNKLVKEAHWEGATTETAGVRPGWAGGLAMSKRWIRSDKASANRSFRGGE